MPDDEKVSVFSASTPVAPGFEEPKVEEPKVEAPKIEKTKAQLEKEARKEELSQMIQDCLKEYNGAESNIGINHSYWEWQNQLRGMK
jgi:hypothetical protein